MTPSPVELAPVHRGREPRPPRSRCASPPFARVATRFPSGLTGRELQPQYTLGTGRRAEVATTTWQRTRRCRERPTGRRQESFFPAVRRSALGGEPECPASTPSG